MVTASEITVVIGTDVSSVSVGRLIFKNAGVAVGAGVGEAVGAGVGEAVGTGVGVNVGVAVTGGGVGVGPPAETNAKPRLSELPGS